MSELGRENLRLQRRKPGDGVLKVTCWCERDIVDVPTAEVWAGRTRTCRRWECRIERLR